MTDKIRVYGAQINNFSLHRVAQGIRGALEELGLLAGFVPIDRIGGDTDGPDASSPTGHDAPIAVYVGPAPGASMMTTMGWHKQRLLMLAPNSSWVPHGMLRAVTQYVTGIVSPSPWGVDVIRRHVDYLESNKLLMRKPALGVWLHGVDKAFVNNLEAHHELVRSYEAGRFHVAHLASTVLERKGTRQLVDAWATAVRKGKLGSKPLLRLVIEGPEGAIRIPSGVEETVVITQQLNMSTEHTARFYRAHHVVCQPSRGEGFGLVGLEARACGVPIVATNVTGHACQGMETARACVLVKTGESKPIDDGPGAMAPELSAADVYDGLLESYDRWLELARHAIDEAPVVQNEWSWRAVTEDWLDAEIVEKRTKEASIPYDEVRRELGLDIPSPTDQKQWRLP